MKPALPDLASPLRKCRGVLVDSNVLLDVATNNSVWAEWSAKALAECANHFQLIVNPIVYAEVSISYSSIESLNAALPARLYLREPLPWEAAFMAGRCFLSYRRRGGSRPTPLPDFYIGAHAAIENLAILTRDVTRYRTCFPTVELLAP